jgi:hypothetical protein
LNPFPLPIGIRGLASFKQRLTSLEDALSGARTGTLQMLDGPDGR